MVSHLSFGCHVIDRAYASTDCTGGVGETIKSKGGVSQACLGKSTSFILDIHNMVNWHLSNQDSHWPYRGLMCQLIEVTWFIWKLSAGQLIVLLDRDQCSISYFLASLGAQLIMHTYWTSMLWSIDSCHTEYPLTSITWAYRRLRRRPIAIRWCAHYDFDALWMANFQDGGEGREISQVICFIFQ